MKQLKLIIAALFVFSPFAASADVIDVTGSVTQQFGLDGIVADGDLIGGSLEVDPTAVATGIVTAADITSIQITLGNLCFTYLGGSCAGDPVDIVEVLATTIINISGGDVVSGVLDLVALSPTLTALFGTDIFVTANFGTQPILSPWTAVPSLDTAALGVAIGTAQFNCNIPCTGATNGHGGGPMMSVPEPGTLALLGLGLAGMGMTRRKKKI